MNDAEVMETTERAEPGEVGLVEPHDFVSNESFVFDSGQTLPGFTLRYETYGRLNAARDNAILVCHALSGDHHCAGINTLADRKPGWWNNLVGPGKAVDTNKFFVICSNVLGGCQGSTGPSSINPATGKKYGITFPFVTVRDMVRAQKRLMDHLGLPMLYAALGGSMGGMQVLQWGIEYPDFVKRMITTATTARESAQGIGFNEVGRQAIMQDPLWNKGDYPDKGGPRVGLAIARMMAHITYVSDASMDRKFGRRQVKLGASATRVPASDALTIKTTANANGVGDTPLAGDAGSSPNGSDESRGGAKSYTFDIQFEVESYLRYQGESFINRFDANSYLYITRAIDHFDLADKTGSLEAAFASVKASTLVIGFTSDWLFPPEQNRRIALALMRAGKRASYAELTTDLGHDSFLLESEELYGLIRNFLSVAVE
ncbi:MAG TPA: homoserine O-acetyltransferase [Opitutaceae bacterium]